MASRVSEAFGEVAGTSAVGRQPDDLGDPARRCRHWGSAPPGNLVRRGWAGQPLALFDLRLHELLAGRGSAEHTHCLSQLIALTICDVI